MSQYKNLTASTQVKTGSGTLLGVVVNSHSSGTLRFNDGTTGTTSAGVKATGVLTVSSAISDGEVALIGDVTYTFKTTLTGAANEVLIDSSVAAALDNLKVAVNAGAGAGTKYGTGTVANPLVTATTNSDTEQTVEAYSVGTYGNAIPTTETMANGAWGATTLASGAESSLLIINTFTFPAGSGVYELGEIDFYAGLYATIGGTIDFTLIYN